MLTGSQHPSLPAPCLADAADNELDRELLQHKQAQAASLAASSNTMLQRVRRFLKPPREELEAMPFGQRMQYEMVNSFLQVRGWGVRFRRIHPTPQDPSGASTQYEDADGCLQVLCWTGR
jgi:hypothetical protein